MIKIIVKLKRMNSKATYSDKVTKVKKTKGTQSFPIFRAQLLTKLEFYLNGRVPVIDKIRVLS